MNETEFNRAMRGKRSRSRTPTLSAIHYARQKAEEHAFRASVEAREQAREQASQERQDREIAKRERLQREMAQIEWRG
jgi:hypothetical protein